MTSDDTVVANLSASGEIFGVPFEAGVVQPNGVLTMVVTVGVELPPDGVSTEVNVEEYALGTERGLEEAFSSYVSTEQVRTVVGGSDSIIRHGSYALSDLDPGADGRVWMVELLTTDEVSGWSVNCSQLAVDASAAAPDLEECNTIVRTFELSNP